MVDNDSSLRVEYIDNLTPPDSNRKTDDVSIDITSRIILPRHLNHCLAV